MAATIPILIYATLTVLFLVILLSTPKPPFSSAPRSHRRLRLRTPSSSSSNHTPISFDPILAAIERRREDLQREREHHHILPPAPGHEAQPEWEGYVDAEDYINDEKRFNVTDRLVVLFPSIDLDPVDGFLTVGELTEWNVRQALKETMHRTERDFEVHDKNKDGFLSPEEYEVPTWALRSDGNTAVASGWWKEEHFNASDLDGDGLLNLTEYNGFLHPADSNNIKLISWLCQEEVRERDKDKDGKLNFQEFFQGLFDSIRDYNEVYNTSQVSDSSNEESAKKLFSKIDQDNDGFLSDKEIKPILDDLHLSDRYYAKQQAEHSISQADIDKDGRLTLQETIEHPYVFYSAIFDDDEDDDYFHDEFR